jgi:hypothetical protein
MNSKTSIDGVDESHPASKVRMNIASVATRKECRLNNDGAMSLPIIVPFLSDITETHDDRSSE